MAVPTSTTHAGLPGASWCAPATATKRSAPRRHGSRYRVVTPAALRSVFTNRGFNPQLWRVTPSSRPLSFDTLAAHALAVAPTSPVTGFTPSTQPDRAYVVQASGVQIMHGGVDHSQNVIRGTCWTAGCHEAIHGSNVNSNLRY